MRQSQQLFLALMLASGGDLCQLAGQCLLSVPRLKQLQRVPVFNRQVGLWDERSSGRGMGGDIVGAEVNGKADGECGSFVRG